MQLQIEVQDVLRTHGQRIVDLIQNKCSDETVYKGSSQSLDEDIQNFKSDTKRRKGLLKTFAEVLYGGPTKPEEEPKDQEMMDIDDESDEEEEKTAAKSEKKQDLTDEKNTEEKPLDPEDDPKKNPKIKDPPKRCSTSGCVPEVTGVSQDRCCR